MKMKKMFSIIAALLMLFAATNTSAANTGASPAAPEDYIGYKVDVESGKYNMTLNLRNNTLSLEPNEETIYLGGPATNTVESYGTEFFLAANSINGSDKIYKFQGYLYGGALKFYTKNGSDAYTAQQYGAYSITGDDVSIYYDSEQDNKHYITPVSDGNGYKFNVQEGWYEITIDINNPDNRHIQINQYSATTYIVGDATEGGYNFTTPMTKKADSKGIYTWSGRLKGKELKFAGLTDWSITSTQLVPTADGIVVKKAGNYSLTTAETDRKLNLDKDGYYSFELNVKDKTLNITEAMGLYMVPVIEGNADWANAIALPYNAATKKYEYSGNISDGKVVFAERYETNQFWHSYIGEVQYIPYIVRPNENQLGWSSSTDQAFNTVAGKIDLNVGIEGDGAKFLTVNTFLPDVLYLEGTVNGTNGWTDASLSKSMTRDVNDEYNYIGTLSAGTMKFAVRNLAFSDGDWVPTANTVIPNTEGTGVIVSDDVHFDLTAFAGDNDHNFNAKAGFYHLRVKLTGDGAPVLQVIVYTPDGVVMYGPAIGQDDIANGQIMSYNSEDQTYNFKGHLQPGLLKLGKKINDETVHYVPTEEITDGIEDGTLTGDVTVLNTRKDENVVLSKFRIGAQTAEVNDYNFSLKGGYYDITVKEIDGANPNIVFNEVRDELRVMGEGAGGWSFETNAKLMTPTLEGFVYEGYLMGLETKFCEQTSGWGPFYTHAWGPIYKSSTRGNGSDNRNELVMGPGASFPVSHVMEDMGNDDPVTLAEGDKPNKDFSKYDSKFDLYPGYYKLTVKFSSDNDQRATLTINDFEPYQKVTVSAAGLATFMSPYFNSSVNDYIYVRDSSHGSSKFVSGNKDEDPIHEFEVGGKFAKLSDTNNKFELYSCSEANEDNELQMVKQSQLKHSTPYIISATPGVYYIKMHCPMSEVSASDEKVNRTSYDANNGIASDGLLRGSWHMFTSLQEDTNYRTYLLQNKPEEIGVAFYWANKSKAYQLAPYSAYVRLPEANTNLSKGMGLCFFDDFDDDDVVTAVDTIETRCNDAEAIYTMDGVMTSQMRKGINIVRMADGKVKKVIKK